MPPTDAIATPFPAKGSGVPRRRFLYLAAGVAGAGAAAAIAVTLLQPGVETFGPPLDVDLKPLKPGQAITVVWGGKPIFVRRRTAAEIERARNDDTQPLPDPARDTTRVQRPEWLVLVGVCTHESCVPLGQQASDPRGDYGGWFCTCHGSHFDTSGRVRKGPALHNLAVPPYRFVDETTLRLG